MSEDGAAWQGRLRQRKPKRTDKELVAIYDGLGGCPDLLRRVALLAVTAPPRYRLRSRLSTCQHCKSQSVN
jgi:hypothetical protein